MLLMLLLLLLLIQQMISSRCTQTAAQANAEHRTRACTKCSGSDSDSYSDSCADADARSNSGSDCTATDANGLCLLGLLLVATQGEEEGEHSLEATRADVVRGDVVQAADGLRAQHVQARVDVVVLQRTE